MIPAAIAFLGGELRAQTVRVQRIDSKVEVAPVGKPGQFSTGQPADIMLSGVGFNNTGGPLLFNHPSGLASDGTRLLELARLSDAGNFESRPPRLENRTENRTEDGAQRAVPREPQGPRANSPGMRLGWPWGVWTDGRKLAAIATHGGSLLLWNQMRGKIVSSPAIANGAVYLGSGDGVMHCFTAPN